MKEKHEKRATMKAFKLNKLDFTKRYYSLW